MKHLKSIHEEFDRVVGFRYSEPKEHYKVSIFCVGEDITQDKINRALNEVSNLKFMEDSIEVREGLEVSTSDGDVQIDAVIDFDILVYTEREIRAIVEELANILSSAFDIEIVHHRAKKDYNI